MTMVMEKQEILEGKQLKSPGEERLPALKSGLPEEDVDTVPILSYGGGCGIWVMGDPVLGPELLRVVLYCSLPLTMRRRVCQNKDVPILSTP